MTEIEVVFKVKHVCDKCGKKKEKIINRLSDLNKAKDWSIDESEELTYNCCNEVSV